MEGFERYLGSNLVRFTAEIGYTSGFFLIVLGKPLLYVIIFHILSSQNKFIYLCIYAHLQESSVQGAGIS